MPPAPQAAPPRSPPEPTQPAFSFMGMVKDIGKLATTSRSQTIDPLTLAKQKVDAALTQQDGLVRDLIDGKPLPKAKGGDKTVST